MFNSLVVLAWEAVRVIKSLWLGNLDRDETIILWGSAGIIVLGFVYVITLAQLITKFKKSAKK